MNYAELVNKAQELQEKAVKISTPFHGFVNHEEAGEAWSNAAEAWSEAEEETPENHDVWSGPNTSHAWDHCTRQAQIHFANCP